MEEELLNAIRQINELIDPVPELSSNYPDREAVERDKILGQVYAICEDILSDPRVKGRA